MTLLVFCLAVGLSACARFGGGGAASSEPSASDPSAGKSAEPVPPGADGDGSQREEPDPTVFDAHAVSVDHFTIGPDGRTVAVYWWGGNATCFGLKDARVDLRDGTPVIMLLEGTREAARDRMCTMEALLKSTLVTLDDPILVDAADPDAPAGEAHLPDGAQRVTVTGGLIDARANAVLGYRLSADGRSLDIHYVGGVEDCYGLAGADVDRQGTGPLQVSIREGRKHGAGACDEIGVVKFVRVNLAETLIVSAA